MIFGILLPQRVSPMPDKEKKKKKKGEENGLMKTLKEEETD